MPDYCYYTEEGDSFGDNYCKNYELVECPHCLNRYCTMHNPCKAHDCTCERPRMTMEEILNEMDRKELEDNE